MEEQTEWYRPPEETPSTDERVPLAILAGVGAAILGGAVWAVIVHLTGYELGYVAWAIGGMVGFAMSRITPRRDIRMAVSGAGLAVLGLFIGRVLIAFVVLGSGIVDEILEDPEFMAVATVAIGSDEQVEQVLPMELIAQRDAVVASGDTLSDALWDEMVQTAESRLDALSEEERQEIAQTYSDLFFGSTNLTTLVTSQLSGYDALWLLFAVMTAWKMLMPAKEHPHVETEPEGEA